MNSGVIYQPKWLYYSFYFLFGCVLIFMPLFISSYGISLMSEILIYGIFVLSLNLLMGYTGLPSFGHAAFFGVGAYTVGLLSTKIIPELGLLNFLLVASLAILGSLVVSMIFGILVVRSSGATFLMLTLALAQVIWAIAFSWRSLTKGDDGIAGIVRPDLGLPFSLNKTMNFYYFILLFFILSYIILQKIVKSPFGNALVGIRENELRMRALGYNTLVLKYIAYIIAGVFGGLAGVLYTYFNRYVNPHVLSIDLSGTAMFMVIIGSRNIFFGPIIGAAVVLLLTYLIGSLTEYWPFFLGMGFVLSIMYARKGISVYILNYIIKIISGLNGNLKARKYFQKF